jgi:hypothetical protein
MTNDPKAMALICWTAPDRWSERLPLELPLFFGPRSQRFPDLPLALQGRPDRNRPRKLNECLTVWRRGGD